MYSRLSDRHPGSQFVILKRALRLLGAFSLVALVTACTTPLQTFELRQNQPEIPSQAEIFQTPFFPQTEYHCGPAALATVLQYHGVSVLPDDLAPMIYTPGLKGSLQVELVAASRRFDLLPVRHDGKLTSLLKEIDAGNPVLVLQNLGLNIYPYWHYAVVVGYDLESQTVMLRSGTEKRLVRSFELFERTWQRTDYWALVIVPPERVPITATADSFLQAALDLEQTGHIEPAHRAYTAASKQWPENLLAHTGVGNTAYALNRYETAVAAYEQGLILQPESHQLWNNLAYAQARLGRKEASLSAINRALQLDPASQNYRHSLVELKQLLSVEE